MPINITIKDVDTVLNEIKEAAIKDVIDEFKALLKDAWKDETDFVKSTAKRLATWTVMLANDELTQRQYERLLKDQKALAESHVNTLNIALRARVQKIAYRILDIGIDILGKAVVIA